MSTICKICISAEENQVVSYIRNVLDSLELCYEESSSEWPIACDHDEFQANEYFPNIFSIKQVTPKVTEIHFNSFSKLNEFSKRLSQSLKTNIVLNIYQSVSTASYWAMYQNGDIIREIEAGDGELLHQSGIPLKFESNHPGHDISEDDDPMYIFDYDDMDRFNKNVGICVEVYQQYDSKWFNLILNTPRKKSSPDEIVASKKPWWKFW